MEFMHLGETRIKVSKIGIEHLAMKFHFLGYRRKYTKEDLRKHLKQL